MTEVADKVTRGLVAAEPVVRFLSLQPDVLDPARPATEPPAGVALHDRVSGLWDSWHGTAAAAPAAVPPAAARCGKVAAASSGPTGEVRTITARSGRALSPRDPAAHPA